ncbi:MAG: sulfatase-like hydrolase/transferase [Mariniphaga sp.]|nr:sulfatase-like hydrolase/transferase [Mariniphaga sp.]MDD4426231.1 sulfatase-like hydrolase/transferase [Mariniphaga sp.]
MKKTAIIKRINPFIHRVLEKKLFFLSLFTGVSFSVMSSSKPNVILILTDDLGYSDISCYRDMFDNQPNRPSTSRTPNIDRLADQGMQFTDFYCGAAVCSPSRSSLMTGRNATRVGIYNWVPENEPMHLRAEEYTLAEMLKDAGYQTGHFGKWHLTSMGMNQPLPTDQGFDYAFFTYNNANPSHRNPENFYRNGQAVGPLEGYSCQLVVNEAMEWLSRIDKNQTPFYVNLWFNEPHEKVAAPEEFSQHHEYRKEYYGCIENMDNAVGRLMEYLKKNNLEDNTLVIFSSDNGSQISSSNNPLRGAKAFNFEGGVRVPFIIKWPGMIPKGNVSSQIGSFTDILPTLASITGASIPSGRTIDGEDISSVFRGSETFNRTKPVFFFRYFHEPVTMLRQDDWILIGYHDTPLPWAQNYDVRKHAKLKPDPGTEEWSMWGFQPRHMEYLKTAIPQHFELYQIREDILQKKDVKKEFPEITEKMKKMSLLLRQEMIEEGGDWYKTN